MASFTRFLSEKLSLKLNEAKSGRHDWKDASSCIANDGRDDALGRKHSLSSKTELGTSPANHDASIWKGSSRTARLNSWNPLRASSFFTDDSV